MAGRLLSARRALACVAAGGVVGGATAAVAPPRLGPLAGWCVAGIIALVWVWRICWPADAATTERLAREESSSRVTDDAIVVACLISIVAVVVALTQSGGGSGPATSAALVILSVLGTMVAWGLVNTVYAFKYARMHFVDEREGGFDVKQDEAPTYSDFACLAFTIGMSYAASDVEPTSTAVRRKVLPHALLSYFFGTVLIAVAINLVTDLGQG